MKSLEIYSSLSKKEIYLTLKEHTNPNSNKRQFRGNVGEDSFSLMRDQFFSNNVLNPQIDACLTENEDETHISVKVTLNKNDKIGFTIMIIIYCCIILFLILTAVVFRSVAPIFQVITILGFGIAVAALSYLIFNIKAQKAVKKLKKVLSAK